MLLDKNPRAGFLSPHAPAGAARPRADCPGFPARLRRPALPASRSPSWSGAPSTGRAPSLAAAPLSKKSGPMSGSRSVMISPGSDDTGRARGRGGRYGKNARRREAGSRWRPAHGVQPADAAVADCGQTLVSYTGVVAILPIHPVVDCGQTLVSYTLQPDPAARLSVVDCGQTLVSYTKKTHVRYWLDVVDCGQTLVSYTCWCWYNPSVVDCGQTLVSYTAGITGETYSVSCGLRTDLGELHFTTSTHFSPSSCGLRTDLGELH